MIALVVLLAVSSDVCPARPVKKIPTVRLHKKKAAVVAPVAVEAEPQAELASVMPASAPVEPAQSVPDVAPPPAPLFRRAEAAPVKSQDTQRFGTALLLCGLMGGAALWATQWKKQKQRRAPESSIHVIASHAFSAKHRVNVVEVGGERMLIAVSEQGVQLLCGLRQDAPPPAFERTLERAENDDEATSPEVAGILRLKRAREQARGLS